MQEALHQDMFGNTAEQELSHVSLSGS